MSTIHLDDTHDPAALSWLEAANAHPDFPIQNLPLGRFSIGDGHVRAGMAVGDQILDLGVLAASGLLSGQAQTACEQTAKDIVSLSPAHRLALRRGVFNLLRLGSASADKARRQAAALLHAATACQMLLPARVPDFTDFNAGIHHTMNGRRLRGQGSASLPANYHQVPIAYHARASSVMPSGTPVVRPWGQIRSGADAPVEFAPVRKLDIELELAIWIGRGNAIGTPIPIGQAADHIAGYGLLNDWSARDVMAWEMDRLGPFLGKNFSTTVSPWIISPEALAPFRRPAYERGSDTAHQPHAYLLDANDQSRGNLEIELAVHFRTERQRAASAQPHCVARSHCQYLYWTPAQMLTHHASNGCNLQPGDLLGTGTVSGPERAHAGSLKELSLEGSSAFAVGDETRTWAQDGDEVRLTATAQRDGFASIGFGDCVAVVLPARHP